MSFFNPREAYDTIHYKNLHKIERGLMDSIELILDYKGKIPDFKIEEDKYKAFDDHTIYGVLAEAIFPSNRTRKVGLRAFERRAFRRTGGYQRVS